MAGDENYRTIKSLFQPVVNDGARPLCKLLCRRAAADALISGKLLLRRVDLQFNARLQQNKTRYAAAAEETSGRRKSKNFAASKSNIAVAKRIKGGKRAVVVEDDHYLRLLRRVPAKID